MLPRIYRKWKSALPDIENAPLFKIVGRNKYYDDGAAKTYRLNEAEKDSWANLFEYKGSEENVRLRFSIDALGAGLDDVVLTYGDSSDSAAWQEFIADQKKERDSKAIPQAAAEKLESETVEKKSARRLLQRLALAALIVVVVGAVGFVSWNYYLSRSQRIDPASLDKMAFPLPDKPSIAVLPFDNMGDDPKDEYFSDGMTEQIITSLSKFKRLFVIARKSTFVYRGKPVKIQKVAEDLGVRYVMEGSFQKSGDRVRIMAQLIDAITGHHIWSEHYDRELKDIFDLQDEITINIMNAVSTELIEGELSGAPRGTRRGTDNLKALEKHYQGVAVICSGGTKEANNKARHLFEEAIAFDPEFAWPYVWLGRTHFSDASLGWSESPAKSLQRAFELAQKALAMDGLDDSAHSLLSTIYVVKRQYDKAVAEAELAVSHNPNGADSYMVLAWVMGCAGRWEESVSHAKKAIRLSPFPGVFYYWVLCKAYFQTGQHDKAIMTCKKALQINPDNLIT
jgi:adenylate cyclase